MTFCDFGAVYWATVCKTVRPICYRTVVLSVCPVCDVGVLWPNGWIDQDETWHADRPRPWPHCVRRGTTSPPQKGFAPISSPYLLWPNCWMDQDGIWHGGGSRSRPHCARWGPSYPPAKRVQSPLPPIFDPFLLWPNGWMHQDATWYGGRPRLRRLCV